MRLDRPEQYNASLATVDPHWAKVWRKPALLLPYWEEMGGEDFSDLANPTAAMTGNPTASLPSFVGTPYGSALLPNGTARFDSDAVSYDGQWSLQDDAFSLFYACWIDATFTQTPAFDLALQRGNFQSWAGSWICRFLPAGGSANKIRFQARDASAASRSYDFNALWNTPGLRTILFVREGTEVRQYTDGVLRETNTATYPVGSFAPAQNGDDLRFGQVSVSSGGKAHFLSAFIANDCILSAEDARALHDDPWAWVRPKEHVPIVVTAAPAGSVGEASGQATVTGAGQAVREATASASGSATVTGIGAGGAGAIASASGQATVTGTGLATANALGSANGLATVLGVGSTAGSTASATGLASVLGTGQAPHNTTASAAGLATVTGVSEIGSVASASGAATVTGISLSAVEGVGQASGQATVQGVGSGTGLNIWDLPLSEHNIPGTFGWLMQRLLKKSEFIALKDD
ncbi:MAG: hypothetical protein QNJ62_05135 [Methyloceanibacter sp.]|nr:hypothetical protein [Methyloceanibacter sp.]